MQVPPHGAAVAASRATWHPRSNQLRNLLCGATGHVHHRVHRLTIPRNGVSRRLCQYQLVKNRAAGAHMEHFLRVQPCVSCACPRQRHRDWGHVRRLGRASPCVLPKPHNGNPCLQGVRSRDISCMTWRCENMDTLGVCQAVCQAAVEKCQAGVALYIDECQSVCRGVCRAVY